MQSSSSGDFQQIQKDFAAYIRSEDESRLPADVSLDRANVYRKLVFNNIKSFLDNNFPVLNEVLGESKWQQLAKTFVAEHPCQTPYFLEIGREFLTWLRQSGHGYLTEFPFAEELAHYEWIELAVAVAEDDFVQSFVGDNLLDTILLVSSNARLLRYDYPVHCIGPDFQLSEKPAEQTFLLIYRDPDFDVQFTEINGLTWLLLERLREVKITLTARQILEQIEADFPQLTVQQVVDGGEQTLQELVTCGVIIGSRTF